MLSPISPDPRDCPDETRPSAPHFVVGVVCCVIGVAAIACSVSLNATFYAQLGRTWHEALVLGGVAGIVDLGKGILPIVIGQLRGQAGKPQVAVAWLAFLVFTMASFVATIGFFAINRTSTIGEQTTLAALHSSMQREITGVESEYRAIEEHRSLAEVDGAIAAVLAETATDKRGRVRSVKELLSDTCASFAADSHALCKQVFDLRRQRALVERRLQLEGRIAALRGQLTVHGMAPGISGDPQVERLSELTTLSKSQVEIGMAVLFALVVELSSGLLLAVGATSLGLRRMRRNTEHSDRKGWEGARHADCEDSAPCKLAAPFEDVGAALVAYAEERLVADAVSETSASAIFHDALGWLAHQVSDNTALTPARLGRFLQNEIGLRAIKRGGRVVYRGIRILEQELPLRIGRVNERE